MHNQNNIRIQQIKTLISKVHHLKWNILRDGQHGRNYIFVCIIFKLSTVLPVVKPS